MDYQAQIIVYPLSHAKRDTVPVVDTFKCKTVYSTIDEESYELVMPYLWFIAADGHVVSSEGFTMAHLILNKELPKDKRIKPRLLKKAAKRPMQEGEQYFYQNDCNMTKTTIIALL